MVAHKTAPVVEAVRRLRFYAADLWFRILCAQAQGHKARAAAPVAAATTALLAARPMLRAGEVYRLAILEAAQCGTHAVMSCACWIAGRAAERFVPDPAPAVELASGTGAKRLPDDAFDS